MCLEAFVKPGECVLSHAPTFIEYRVMSEIRCVRYIETLPAENLSLNQALFLETIEKEQPALIFLCNPNNPTGELLPEAFIEKVIRMAPGVVVLDEAYSEFGGESFMARLPEFPKLLILRTLSKAFGLAALRVGYALTTQENAEALDRVRMPYNISAISQALAVLVLSEEGRMTSELAITKSERDRVFNALIRMKGIEPLKSSTNFILVKTTPEILSAVKSAMMDAGLKLRYFKTKDMLGEYFRITIGKIEDNDVLLSVLMEVLS
jgi:histidinol-phosphate aminotransferase